MGLTFWVPAQYCSYSIEIYFHHQSHPHLGVVFALTPFFSGEGNDDPLQYSCLENPLDRRAWWAAIYGVAQSQTLLKQLSMHASIGAGNGNPLQYSCLENPRDRRAWWAAIYGVAQSDTTEVT